MIITRLRTYVTNKVHVKKQKIELNMYSIYLYIISTYYITSEKDGVIFECLFKYRKKTKP